MKKIALLFLISCSFAQISQANVSDDPNLGIIPAPASVTRTSGNFILQKNTFLSANNAAAKQIAAMLNKLLKERYGFTIPIKNASSGSAIIFIIQPGSEPKEGYELSISPQQIKIKAGDGAGLFYGMQSLAQLFPDKIEKTYQLPCAIVKDYPRFAYRGMHLDCGRHFFPVSFVKEYIDLMSRYKTNTFHWHLTEDQGWRIEIKKYPKLTEVGSHRPETVIGHNSGLYDGQPEGGFYTQDQIRDVVKYAQERYVTIIPEIEMPGHSQAALAAYPWLGCTGFGPTYQVMETWGVTPDVYCPGKETTFKFIEDVLTEVMALFPSHYIHIGGDECPKDHWKLCPDCQKRMKENGLKNVEELQSYFVQRIEKFLNAHGRDIIGWDEILEGGLAPNATVMSWRGEQGGIAAAKEHHNVIMTPGDWLYLDHNQGDVSREPTSIGGYLPLSKVYGYNPLPAALTADEKKYVIGMQANVWSEYIPTTAQAEYMVFPRMLAVAEAAWTPLDKKSFTDFQRRLPNQLAWLNKQHVHFRIPEPEGLHDIVTTNDSVKINLTPAFPGAKIYYTLDGSLPVSTAKQYVSSFTLPLPDSAEVTLNCIEVTPDGNTSVPYSATYMHRNFEAAKNYTANRKGISFKLFKTPPKKITDMNNLTPDSSGVMHNPDMRVFGRNPFGIIFSGYVYLDSSALYQFNVRGRNAQLYVDGEPSGNDNNSGRQSLMPLQKGYHQIALYYISNGGRNFLFVQYGIKGVGMHNLGRDDMFY